MECGTLPCLCVPHWAAIREVTFSLTSNFTLATQLHTLISLSLDSPPLPPFVSTYIPIDSIDGR